MAVRGRKKKISLRRKKVIWADQGRIRPYRVGKRKSSLRRERVVWADRAGSGPTGWW
jgi:hypothetical protein